MPTAPALTVSGVSLASRAELVSSPGVRLWLLIALVVFAACGSRAPGATPRPDAALDVPMAPVRDADPAEPFVEAPVPDVAEDAPLASPDAAAPDATADQRETPPPVPADVTFFAFGDPQYGGGPSDKNSFHIQALNAAAELTWPAGFTGAGRPVGAPRGVVIAGDLTQNGQAGRNPLGEWYTADAYAFDLRQYGVDVPNPRISAELGLFLRDYGLAGNDGLNPHKLRWRVFEGYGNHDFDVLERFAALYGGAAPAVDVVAIRNQVRGRWPEIRRVAPGNGGHYAWEWDGLHLVQLNLAGADAAASGGVQGVRDPRGALSFLRADLATLAPCQPVMVVMHYGFDAFSAEARWWDEAQRMAFLDVLAPHHVIAILHGHVHETRAYRVADRMGKAYDVFSLGSPYYQGQPTNGGRGHFAIFRLHAGRLEAADVSWLPANPVPGMANNRDLWTGKRVAELAFQLTTTFPDGWGGWRFSKSLACERR